MDVPEDIRELRRNALNCVQDAQWTHAERSEHCVFVAENMFENDRRDCWKSSSSECINWKYVSSDISLLYYGAIAESLFQHGKSEEVRLIEQDSLWREIYLNGELMRELFDDCLRKETEELEKIGFVPVHQATQHRLQDGQRCFRQGYPEFEPDEVVSS